MDAATLVDTAVDADGVTYDHDEADSVTCEAVEDGSVGGGEAEAGETPLWLGAVLDMIDSSFDSLLLRVRVTASSCEAAAWAGWRVVDSLRSFTKSLIRAPWTAVPQVTEADRTAAPPPLDVASIVAADRAAIEAMCAYATSRSLVAGTPPLSSEAPVPRSLAEAEDGARVRALLLAFAAALGGMAPLADALVDARVRRDEGGAAAAAAALVAAENAVFEEYTRRALALVPESSRAWAAARHLREQAAAQRMVETEH
jgi:hypothetical protein